MTKKNKGIIIVLAIIITYIPVSFISFSTTQAIIDGQQTAFCKNYPEKANVISLDEDSKEVTIHYCNEDNKPTQESILFEDTIKGQNPEDAIRDLNNDEYNEILDLMNENKKGK